MLQLVAAVLAAECAGLQPFREYNKTELASRCRLGFRSVEDFTAATHPWCGKLPLPDWR